MSIFRWVEQPVQGPTTNVYRVRMGYRRMLWLLFIPVWSSTVWKVEREQ